MIHYKNWIIISKYSENNQTSSYRLITQIIFGGFVVCRRDLTDCDFFNSVCMCVCDWRLTSGCHVDDSGLLVSRNMHVEKLSHYHSSYPSNGIIIYITFRIAWLSADDEWLRMFLIIQKRLQNYQSSWCQMILSAQFISHFSYTFWKHVKGTICMALLFLSNWHAVYFCVFFLKTVNHITTYNILSYNLFC